MKVKAVPILQLDPDLAAGIPPARLALATRCCQARVVEVPQGEWTGTVEGIDESALGLLVLSGVLCRRVAQSDSQHGAELVGPGDLLRPWDQLRWSTLPIEANWTVIEPARLAVLDEEFAHRASHFPQLNSQLMGRALIRSRYLSVLIAIVSERRIETRLTMLFWHLADRFGQMRGEWVEIPVSLTHSTLSELVAARRPSVSTAISQLQERGMLRREDGGWWLQGTVPPELLGLSESGHRQEPDAG